MNKTVRLSIDISEELHHYLKIQTARTKDTIRNYVKEAIYNKVDQEKTPNKETLKVLEDSRNGIGITKFASIEDLYKDLGI